MCIADLGTEEERGFDDAIDARLPPQSPFKSPLPPFF
jgi:hypothetical protein